MCVQADFRTPQKLTETIYAYKEVRRLTSFDPVKYGSVYDPLSRVLQSKAAIDEGYGSYLSYEIGKPAYSPFFRSPGLYCYENLIPCSNLTYGTTLLLVEIPKGTQVVRGTGKTRLGWPGRGIVETINAEKIIPRKVCLELSY